MPYCTGVWWILIKQLPGHMAQYVGDGMGKQEQPQSRDHHKVPPRNDEIPLLTFNEYCRFPHGGTKDMQYSPCGTKDMQNSPLEHCTGLCTFGELAEC